MKDGVREAEQVEVEVSRQQLYEDYKNCFLQCSDIGPCRDAPLLKRTARYLLREPEPGGTFTVFPFYQALGEGCGAQSADCGRLLSAFIKAAELLETLCVNLFLQPWKKEIKTLKTFTGPFVYCLLPVFSSPTIQSVLASIGYLPHTDTAQREYRLSEDANPDRAMLVGFELLLARVECHRLLELLDQDQLGPQECLEFLQRRAGPTQLEAPTEMKTTIEQREEEEEEVLQYLDTRITVNPVPKPRRSQLISEDQSIMEMQRNYPDLAIRGRRLLQDKPQRAHGGRSGRRAAHTATDDRTDCIKDTRAAAAAATVRDNTDDVFVDDSRSSGWNDGSSGRSRVQGDAISSSFSHTDGGRGEDELSHPQAASLHLTLRAGATAEAPAWTQQQDTADLQNKRPAHLGLLSQSSMEEEQQQLRELAEKMGQLHVHETIEDQKRKDEENANKERRKKERKASAEREAEEQDLRRQTMDTGPVLSHAASISTRSSQSDPAVMTEPVVCQPLPLSVSTDCQRCRGGSTGQQDGEETGKGEEEQLAHSYVIVEHHKK
ncbi:uncharacterized protein ABDE67_013987 [Symphorus nematophorus]